VIATVDTEQVLFFDIQESAAAVSNVLDAIAGYFSTPPGRGCRFFHDTHTRLCIAVALKVFQKPFDVFPSPWFVRFYDVMVRGVRRVPTKEPVKHFIHVNRQFFLVGVCEFFSCPSDIHDVGVALTQDATGSDVAR
jgi:hypothetical protein